MKRQKSCGPRLGKLVRQLPGVVTFAYDLHFRRTIARWKGITEKNDFQLAQVSASGNYLGPKSPKKRRLGPQNDPGSLEPEKLPRWKNIFQASGIGGWPLISIWIIIGPIAMLFFLQASHSYRLFPVSSPIRLSLSITHASMQTSNLFFMAIKPLSILHVSSSHVVTKVFFFVSLILLECACNNLLLELSILQNIYQLDYKTLFILNYEEY
jgi:hypothetical protein